MAVFAITMVRDEADVVAATVGHMIGQVDQVVVLDNGSTDGTRAILSELDCVVDDDPERGYYQSRKMTELARQVGAAGADWVVPFDADEIWLAPDGRTVADALVGLEPHFAVATAQMFNHYATGTDPDAGSPVERMGWRTREALPLPKVACRPALPVTIDQGNHAARYPQCAVADGVLEVRHFPYRSPEQFVSKARNGAAAYAATDLDRTVGLHWREYGELVDRDGEGAGHDWFREHFYFADPDVDPQLVYDPAPIG
jgi:glycosyltransferase involved in cell wall biosynthesis